MNDDRVPAGTIREHLEALQAVAISRRAVASYARCSMATLADIAQGRTATVRATTAALILEIPAEIIVDVVAVQRVLDEEADVATLTRYERQAAVREAVRMGKGWDWIADVLRASGRTRNIALSRGGGA